MRYYIECLLKVSVYNVNSASMQFHASGEGNSAVNIASPVAMRLYGAVSIATAMFGYTQG